MILKIIGAILILTGSGGMGFWYAGQWKGRLKTLESMRKMIYMLKGEIVYANAPLEEAFYHVGRKMEEAGGSFFLELSEKMENNRGEPFVQIWNEQVENWCDSFTSGNFLSKADKRELLEFGKSLGYLDVQMQERTILLYLEQLDLGIDYLRMHEKEQCRLYSSLGIMGGLFLTILLC